MKRQTAGPVAAVQKHAPTSSHNLRLRTSVAVLLGAGLLGAFPAQAQENPASPDPDAPTVVLVTGVRKAAQSAQKIKQDADNVIDSIVADDIGKFPDTNVAQTLARVSGIQVQRNAGEANTVLIRGLPGIATVLNGRELFTTTGRYINLADIPSTMLQRVDVYKSQSADLIEGGIAGVIDVRTNRPFDFKGFTASVNAGAQNNSAAGRTDPNVSMLLSNRWKTDIGEFGALAGVSYVRNHYQQESAFNTKPIDKSFALPNLTGPDLMGIIPNFGDRRRLAENAALQWKPNKDVEVYAEGLSTHYLNDFESDYFVGLPWAGTVLSATKIPGTNQTQTLNSRDVFTITSTQANHNDNLTQQYAVGTRWNAAPGLKLSTEIAHTASRFDWQNPILDTSTTVPNVAINTNQGGSIALNYTGIDMTDAKNYNLFQLFDRYGKDRGSSTDWRADASYLPEDGIFKEFSTGVRVARRSADSIKSFEGSVPALAGVSAASVPGLACVSPNLIGSYGSLTNWFSPCSSFMLNNTAALRQAVTGSAAAKALDPGSFFQDIEKNYAIYGKARLGFDVGAFPVETIFGVRVTKTDAQLQGNSIVDSVYVPINSSSSGTDVLPSASMKINLRQDLIGRLAYAKTLTRPDFAQLNPGTAYINSGVTVESTASGGNPNLKPFTGQNVDAALEYYFAPTAMVSATVFRHDFDGYIMSQANPETYNGVTFNTTRPFNTDKGYLQGVEVAYQQFYDQLPGWLGGFGLQANATYMEGQTTSSIDPSLANRPFAGMSKWSYNVVALYERGGVSARLAYNWRSKYVQLYNDGGPGLDLIAAPTSSLDGSLSYKISDNLAVTINGSNLLNFKYTDYWADKSTYPRDTRRYDRSVGLYLNWKN
jgi:iron complex outermembrane receptor protein